MNKPHAPNQEQREARTKRNAARDLRTANETREAAQSWHTDKSKQIAALAADRRD